MLRFSRGVSGSSPGRGTDGRQTEGPPDRRRDPVGSRLSDFQNALRVRLPPLPLESTWCPWLKWLRTPACEAGGKGSTPFGHPCPVDKERSLQQGAQQTDADSEPQLAAGERGLRGPVLVLVCRGTVRVVDPQDYQLYTWEDWTQLVPDRDEPFVRSVWLRVRCRRWSR